MMNRLSISKPKVLPNINVEINGFVNGHHSSNNSNDETEK
jgi:hypothetical protein